MHQFKDSQGEKWEIVLDTTKVRSLREALGIDLFAIDENSALEALMNDDVVLVDCVSWICTSQIEQRQLSVEEFCGRLTGDALDDACDALIDELVFICRRRKREVIAAAWDKAKTFQGVAAERAIQAIQSTELEQQVTSHVDSVIRGGMTSQSVPPSSQ